MLRDAEGQRVLPAVACPRAGVGRAQRMLVFFSNRLGCAASLLVSVVLSALPLLVLRAL